MTETLRKAKNIVGAANGYSCCRACGDTWDWKEFHSTQIDQSSGMFPLCEECWKSMTPAERVPFYEALLLSWNYPPWTARLDEVRKAVLEEVAP